MVTVANGLEVSPNDDTEDDIDFTQAVLDPDTGLMCVYNQGPTFRKMSALYQHMKHFWVSMILEKFTFCITIKVYGV